MTAGKRVVHVIHENPNWFAPVADALDAAGISVREWLITEDSNTTFDLSSTPPEGVFWSRLSASAHTRGNAHAKDFGRALLGWLEDSGRRVVNGSRALELEVSKIAQHRALAAHGFDVPRTTAVFGRTGLTRAARTFPAPFIVKHNQGGKGLGVHRFDSHGELEYYASTIDEFEEAADGITLVQEYLVPREPFITRAEFVGGRFVYAIRVDTAGGSFQLCPADPEPDRLEQPLDRFPFSLRDDLDGHPVIAAYERFLADAGVEIAGIEFIETVDGRLVTYDVNTNTNYNPTIEATARRSGTAAVADFFSRILDTSDARRPVHA